jgi:hypothetical protein
MVKYVLIISQYYHSYVQIISEVNGDFIKNARMMIEELEKHKRYNDDERPIYYGDLDKKYSERTERVLEQGGRINLNDAGDIYFEFSNSIMHLANEMSCYENKSNACLKYNKKDKKIMLDCAEHHGSGSITDIIKKYFKPA